MGPYLRREVMFEYYGRPSRKHGLWQFLCCARIHLMRERVFRADAWQWTSPRRSSETPLSRVLCGMSQEHRHFCFRKGPTSDVFDGPC
jgi:hypothetical protein